MEMLEAVAWFVQGKVFGIVAWFVKDFYWNCS
jgi:hypothetical protein